MKAWLLMRKSYVWDRSIPLKVCYINGRYTCMSYWRLINADCLLLTYAAVCILPWRGNFAIEGVLLHILIDGKHKIMFGQYFHAFMDYYVNFVMWSKWAKNTKWFLRWFLLQTFIVLKCWKEKKEAYGHYITNLPVVPLRNMCSTLHL